MMDEPQPNFDIIKKYYPHFMYNMSKVCDAAASSLKRRMCLFFVVDPSNNLCVFLTSGRHFTRRAVVCTMRSLVKSNSRN